MNVTTMEPVILGIDPGTKEMGLAVVRGRRLLAADVKTLRNGERPHDVIGQARRVVLEYIQDFNPAVVGIEKPLLVPTKRAALVSVIAQELESRSREIGIRVLEISPLEIRRVIVGDPYAKKLDVARAIVAMGFHELNVNLPKAPPHPVFGYKPRDRYWLHMFDALGVALAADRLLRSRAPIKIGAT